MSAHRCRSGRQRARWQPEQVRRGSVAGVEPVPGLNLGGHDGVGANSGAGAAN